MFAAYRIARLIGYFAAVVLGFTYANVLIHLLVSHHHMVIVVVTIIGGLVLAGTVRGHHPVRHRPRLHAHRTALRQRARYALPARDWLAVATP